MSYTTQNFESSALSNLYPSYYKEIQFVNWTNVDLVITEADGTQQTLQKSTNPVGERESCLSIEYRSCNGMRIRENSLLEARVATRDIPLPAKRIHVPFDKIRNSPERINEFNVIVSTVEQSLVAKNMMLEINYGTFIYENRTDEQLVDPRFVFQVVDPNHLWDAVFVNVFGQTVILRAGRFGQVIPSDPPEVKTPDPGRLICYLRYPDDYCAITKPMQTVFEIPLDIIYQREPVKLPGGDILCVACDQEGLQEVIAKKASCTGGVINSAIQTNQMIPKSVYDAAVENHKTEIERIKKEQNDRYNALATAKASEISSLKAQISDKDLELERCRAQVKEWEGIHDAVHKQRVDEQKFQQETEKTRKEARDNARQDVENMWMAIKYGGAILSAVTSFAITVLIKSKK